MVSRASVVQQFAANRSGIPTARAESKSPAQSRMAVSILSASMAVPPCSIARDCMLRMMVTLWLVAESFWKTISFCSLAVAGQWMRFMGSNSMYSRTPAFKNGSSMRLRRTARSPVRWRVSISVISPSGRGRTRMLEWTSAPTDWLTLPRRSLATRTTRSMAYSPRLRHLSFQRRLTF